MKKIVRTIYILLLLALAAYGHHERWSFTDARDGKNYKVVRIGTQIWLAENLNYEAKGSVCYNNEPANCDKYGRLYNLNTAMKACPKSWHLPSKQEWEILTATIGGEDTEGKHLKAKSGWNNNGNGDDTYGFSALPGGGGVIGHFGGVGDSGGWWSNALLHLSCGLGL